MTDKFIHGYALLIGVGETLYKEWSLPVTVKDIQAIQMIFTDAQLCAYPNDESHLRILRDNTATRDGILHGLGWLQTQAHADTDATIVVYYSGHGWLDKSTGNYYLIPHDADPLDIPNSFLSAEDFTTMLRTISAQRLVVFIDSCHAEGMATAKGEPELKLPSGFMQKALPKSLVSKLKRGEGRAVSTSSRGEQRSWVRPDGKMSIYTYHLLEALQGADNQPGDTVVRILNVMNHLGKTVPESARKLCKAEQTPFLDAVTENFPIAMLRGGKGFPAGGWDALQNEAIQTINHIVTVIGDGNLVGDSSISQVIKADRGSQINNVTQSITR